LQFQDAFYNTPVQAAGADGFKLALVRISEKLKGFDARIVHAQHDEIIGKRQSETTL
jgi:DNA polymerase I-like protein with 3'-5' exonuclease and polymerase domains